MKTYPLENLDREYFTAEELDEIEAEVASEVLEINLQLLRESLGMTQSELAGRADMSQGQISRIEARKDHLTSTLRRYIEAMGGEMEISAIFNGKKITLKGV